MGVGFGLMFKGVEGVFEGYQTKFWSAKMRQEKRD
jgi:hypothetical protein